MAIDSPALSQIWQDLRPHLEWASGFSLVFLFADQSATVAALRQLYGDSLHMRALRLRELKPSNSAQLAGLAEEMLKTRVGFGPLWVELWQGGEEADWDRQRIRFLHRLNENRSALERNIRQPVVIVLPVAERLAVSVHAPDLWAVRSFTKQLPTLAPARPDTILPSASESKSVMALASEPGQAEQEWTRLLSLSQNTDSLNLWDGFAAFDAAMERGSLESAKRIATETLNMARERLKPKTKAQFWSGWLQKPPSPNPERLRDLSVSLEKVGNVEADLGNLEPARAAYRESLVLRRQLRDSLGDTPQALRDLSVSLDNVGQVEAVLGNLEPARAAYRESLDLSRQLRDSLGDTP
ncbi:MAG: tetratricopeptide repeat protein, partial [Proteobacteria bacterium]|nr:tetratricopeptide repeat protein [Pseudomonadota bacterium]